MVKILNYDEVKNEDLVFSKLTFELTRRCNMNCIHCAKGCSQNLSITKEIIDATLDTVKNNKIYTVELFGGEPTLEPDLVEYIANGLINRKINFASLSMNTNGLIKSKKISDAFNKVGEYLSRKQDGVASDYRNFIKKEFKKLSGEDLYYEKYFGEERNCIISVSTYAHEKEKEAYNGYTFYKKNANKYVSVRWQTEYKEYTNKKDGKELLYIYMGNAVDNYERLRKDHNFRIKDKRGSLRSPYSKLIDVPIYICANGNIVNSDLISYTLEDSVDDCMGNILVNNLFEKMDEWNFKYPLNHNQRHLKEWCKTEIFNYENGVTQIYKNHPEYQLMEKDIEKAKIMLDAFDFIEQTKRNCHNQFPYLTFDEVQFMGDTALEIKFEGKYLQSDFSGYEKGSGNYLYDEKECIESINAYATINNSRKPMIEDIFLGALTNLFKGKKV